MKFLGRDQGLSFTILETYGPPTNRVDFWHNLFEVGFHKMDWFILASDLNFSMGEAETWGEIAS